MGLAAQVTRQAVRQQIWSIRNLCAAVVWALLLQHVTAGLSIHVPLYNPHLSATTADTLGVLWAAKHFNRTAISVAICSRWDFQPTSDRCRTVDNQAATALLRAAGVTVYHYVPSQQIPVPKTGPPECCNSLKNITRFVTMALEQPGASQDGIYLDLATHDMSDPSKIKFFSKLFGVAKHGSVDRPIMINPSVPQFLSAHLEEPNLRVNAFESTITNLETQTPGMHSFNWSQFSASRFAGVVESAANISAMEKAVDLLQSLHYGAVYVEPDVQDYWNLPGYWEQLVRYVASRNASSRVT